MEIKIEMPVLGFDKEDLVGSFASAAASCGAWLVKNQVVGDWLILGFGPDSPELATAISNMAEMMGIR